MGAEQEAKKRRVAQRPVAVVGGGSAGVSAVAALAADRPVVWYDVAVPPWIAESGSEESSLGRSAFSAGELQSYQSVPANSKLDKVIGRSIFGNPVLAPWFAASAGARAALQNLIEGAVELPQLDKYDPSMGWVGLDACSDVFLQLSKALIASDQVTCVEKKVESVALDSASGTWTLRAGDHITEAAAIVLAIGGAPRVLPLPAGVSAKQIPLTAALNPEELSSALAMPAEDARVAIIGNSHSAVVVLDHCRKIGVQKVTVIARRPVRHAEWIDDAKDYQYTMSGLKGLGSLIGRRYLDGSVPQDAGEGAWKGAREVVVESEAELQSWLAHCTHAVQAVGFDGAPLPALSIDGYDALPWSIETLEREPASSQLFLPQPQAHGLQLQGVYGLGLMLPEDKGFCKTSPDERPTGFAFANSCAARAAADLAKSPP